MWVYVALIGLIVGIYIYTWGYKGEMRQKVDKNRHKLWMFYGISMFLVDKPFKRVFEKNSILLDDRFKNLYVKENVREEKYMYVVSKMALAVVVVFVTGVFGIGSYLTEGYENKKITYISRKEYGEGETVYNLQVEAEGEKERMQIVVSPKEYSDDEKLKLLESYREELVKEMLGENKSEDYIVKPLNLVSDIGKEYIPVVWIVDDDGVINVDGTLCADIDPKGERTKVTAVLSLNNVSVTHDIELLVFPEEQTGGWQSQIQKMVNEYDSEEKNIILPETIADRKVSYLNVQDDSAKYIFPIGLMAAIVVFAFKDREIDQQMKERRYQMMMDYPEIVSKIVLYTRAGTSMRKAWELTVQSCGSKKEHYAYREMQMTLGKINGGVPEGLAYEQFGKRCREHCYIRFANIISQNLRRGNSDLCRALDAEMDNALQERKNSALKKGEEVGTKLLGPMVIMLIIGLGIIIVPAFMSLQ